jgi:hypothetical protein
MINSTPATSSERTAGPHRGFHPSRLLAAGLLSALLGVAGCESVRVADPLTRTAGGSDPEQQLAFWHGLAERPVTSNDEAFHAVLLFVDGEESAGDYDARVASLKGRKMLPAGFNRPSDEAVERGNFAVALSRALAIRGGVVMSVFGPSPRYATKELEFLNVYPPSSPNQTFSGAELLGVMSKAEEHQQARAGPSRDERIEQMRGMEKAGPLPPVEVAPTTQPARTETPTLVE